MIKQIKKRSGSVVPFDAKKITEAIWKAAEAVDGKDRERAEFLAAEVVHHLEGKFQENLPSVEDVQDEVEKVLIEFGHAKTAKAFILYRQKRKEMREARERLGINEETKISLNALKILEERYLCKDENGKVIETPSQLFRRVAHNISLADQRYGQDAKKSEEEFFGLMTAFDFLPNSPTLMNAGTSIQQLSACFVLPIEDDIPQIFDSVKNTAIIHKTGGGCIKKGSRIFSTFCGSERIERLYEYFENETNHSTEGEAVYLDVSQENLKVPSFQSSSGRMTFQPVERIWKYLLPSEKTFKIKCEGGYTAETSEWHPFFTFDQGEVKEKRADELKKGDYLLISNPSIQKEWPFSEKWQAGDLTIDEEMAWLSGFFSTDGSIDETKQGLRVRFFSSEKEIVDRTLKILKEKTGIDYAVSVDERSLHPVTRIAVYNKKMTEALKILNRNLVGRKEILVRVPAQIFKSPVPIIGAYLAGVMDGDGYVAEKKKQIEIAGASNEFIEDLSSLFYLLGIKSRCRERKDKRNAEWLMLYELTISDHLSLKRFSELVLPHLALTRKRERLSNHLNGEHSSLPTPLDFSVIGPYLEEAGVKTKSTEIWRRSIGIGNNKFFLARWKEKGKISLVKSEALITALVESDISSSSKEKLRKLLYILPNLIPIKSVTRNDTGRTEEFYDFTVNETNNYLAGNRGLSIIHNTGFSFSRLRPKGDLVGTTGGIASGPISFMKVFDCATEQIKQGGKRRGANMGILRVDHPDILEFIGAKEKNTEINNFNLSVAITDAFMEAVEKNEDYDLINPRGKRVVGRLNAKHVFNLISMMAWKNGEPGVVFIDRMNQFNPTPNLGPIESTNPCVAGNTLIPTLKGYIRIEELAKETGETETVVDTRLTSSLDEIALQSLGTIKTKINRVWKSGIKDTYKIKTLSGYELVATADHKIMTVGGWKEVKNLTFNDNVLIQSGEGLFSTKYKLPFPNPFVDTWSKELGQIVGWLVGDGWLRVGDKNCRVGFVFSQEDKEIMDYLKPILNRLYGKEINEVLRDNGVFHLSYHAQEFGKFFQQLGVKAVRAGEKSVPESILSAPREAVIGFLQGLFTSDGTVVFDKTKNNRYVRLTSKSDKLLKGVQLLLLNLGIKSRIYERHRNKRISFSYQNKQGELRLYESDGILYELQISKDMIPRFLSQISFLGQKHKERIEDLKKAEFYHTTFEDRINSIEFDGLKEVYDLAEPLTHSFIANGIIVHNCGEQPLLPYESCNLGSLNLVNFVDAHKKIDWDRLKACVHRCAHFLDNVIDMNKYPLPEIKKLTEGNRKIGLGVMGWADALIKMELPYNDPEAVKLADEVMCFINLEAMKASAELAKKRGTFPNFKDSIYDTGKTEDRMRNATRTTIAPTGTISILSSCSSGIEPLFAISYLRKTPQFELLEVNPLFEEVAKEEGFYSEELMCKIAGLGSIKHVEEIPEKWKRIFVTAMDLTPEDHVRMQAAFQKHTNNAVSKTVNFPNSATVEEVAEVYRLAYNLGCKGTTIYRDGSRDVQVLNVVKEQFKEEPKAEKKIEKKPVTVAADYAGGCTTCHV